MPSARTAKSQRAAGARQRAQFGASSAQHLYCITDCAGVSCGVRTELKAQLAQERQERQALERELQECKQQMADAGLL